MESKELNTLKRELEAWRSSKSRGRFIPEDLWQRAAALTHTLGVTRVHQELRLDFTALKKRMDGSKKTAVLPSKPKASFVRLPLSSGSRVEGCVLKIESTSGARMQAEISGLETTALSQIIREFAAS